MLLERVKAGEGRWIDRFLQEEAELLRRMLRAANLTPGEQDRVEALIREVDTVLRALYGGYIAGLQERMLGTAETMREAEVRALALQKLDAKAPGSQVIRAAVATAPLSVRGAGGRNVARAVRPLLGRGRSGAGDWLDWPRLRRRTDDRAGSPGDRRNEGKPLQGWHPRRQAAQRAHGRAHSPAERRHDRSHGALKANDDIVKGYRWVSTLDGRTSSQCRSLDGREFQFGKGPVPPAHPNCRSTITPVTRTCRELGIDAPEFQASTQTSADGQVPAGLTYYQWLKTQPIGFVEEALGPTRAKVFLDGGVDAEEFARLQLARNFLPLTVEDLRQKIPRVFELAGV